MPILLAPRPLRGCRGLTLSQWQLSDSTGSQGVNIDHLSGSTHTRTRLTTCAVQMYYWNWKKELNQFYYDYNKTMAELADAAARSGGDAE